MNERKASAPPPRGQIVSVFGHVKWKEFPFQEQCFPERGRCGASRACVDRGSRRLNRGRKATRGRTTRKRDGARQQFTMDRARNHPSIQNNTLLTAAPYSVLEVPRPHSGRANQHPGTCPRSSHRRSSNLLMPSFPAPASFCPPSSVSSHAWKPASACPRRQPDRANQPSAPLSLGHGPPPALLHDTPLPPPVPRSRFAALTVLLHP